jgi:chemosensory pili system protein ChpA (sensor histidine kinase/response regulator)
MAEIFDIGPLSWVKDEIDQSLQKVIDNFRDVEKKPSQYETLRFSLTHLYQVNGALDMVGLEGSKRYCIEIESLTTKIEKGIIAAEKQTMKTLVNAVQTLMQYLQDLLNGLPDTPLRLLDSLKLLADIQGETLEPTELFYPNTTFSAPSSIPSTPLEGAALIAYLAEQRGIFQKSFLAWLQNKKINDIEAMRTALFNVQKVQPKKSHKTLWWVATAFIDALMEDSIADQSGAKKLCRRLDQQLRLMAIGETKVPSNLLRDVLYYVAISQSQSVEIVKVKSVFELQAMLPQQADKPQTVFLMTDAERLAISQLASEVPVLKELWVSVSDHAGDEAVEQQIPLEELQGVSIKLQFLLEYMQSAGVNQDNPNNQDIIALLDATQKVAQKLLGEIDHLSEAAVLEVATGLNLLESMSTHYAVLEADHHQKVVEQLNRLLQIYNAEVDYLIETDLSLFDLDSSVIEAVSTQIIEALRISEKAIDGFFRNVSQADSLDDAVRPLTQVVAAFDMLEMPTPKTIAKLSLLYLEQFKAHAPKYSEPHPNVELFNIFAEGISLLGLCAKDLPEVSAQSKLALSDCLSRLEQGIDAFIRIDLSEEDSLTEEDAVEQEVKLAQLDEAREVVNQATEDAEKISFVEISRFPDEEVADQAIHEELKSIFIEEAQELLETNVINLQVLRDNEQNQMALTDVRRSFHTLKGSGRTVGLEMMGDVAHAIEKLLNILLEYKSYPSAEVLDFVSEANEAFIAWINHLKSHSYVTLNAGKYQQRAAELAKPLEYKLIEAQPKPRTEDVLIGGSRKVGRAFFYLFLGEAQLHLNTLTQAKRTIKVNSVIKPSPSIIRAAHTLSSNALTAGFDDIGDLARGLEHWLEEFTGSWTDKQIALYSKVIASLKEGLDKAKSLQHPKSTRALVIELSKSTAAMQVLASTVNHESPDQVAFNKQAKPEVELSDDEMLGTELSEAEMVLSDEEVDLEDDVFFPNPNPNFDPFKGIDLNLTVEDSAINEPYESGITAAFNFEQPIIETELEKDVETDQDLDKMHFLASTTLTAPVMAKIQKPTVEVTPKKDLYHLPTPVFTYEIVPDEKLDVESTLIQNDGLAGYAEEDTLPIMEVEEVEVDEVLADEAEPLVQDLALSVVEAASSTQIEPEVSKPVFSELDQELLALFTEEASELVPNIGRNLRMWKNAPSGTQYSDALLRDLHTLKGSARTAGQAAIGDRVHELEDRIVRIVKHQPSIDDFDAMFIEFDRISFMLEDLINQSAQLNTADIVEIEEPIIDMPEDLVEINNDISLDNQLDIEHTSTNELGSPFLRVKASMLDSLITEAGEVSILRSRMDREMQSIKQSSIDLTLSVNRLHTYLQELEFEADAQLQSRMNVLKEENSTFDPLELDRFTRLQELTRLMAEGLGDVTTIQQSLVTHIDETDGALQQQNRMNRSLQKGLMTVRMMPFSSLSERLHRIVRQIARELNKRVELSIHGEEIELDRSVLDKIGAPIEHVLRNAVAHGIESAEERTGVGKSSIGKIDLNVSVENDEITLTISDDGRGINLEKVKEIAIEKGLLDEKQTISDETLIAVIFESGFSTEAAVSKIAGRGVGLDAVRSDIAALNGRIDLSNRLGAGTTFNIYLPVSLSVTQVVIVQVNGQAFAIPSVMVEQVQTLKQEDLVDAYDAQKMDWAGNSYPLSFLSRLLGDTDYVAKTQAYTPIIHLRSGQYRAALHVDEVLGNQEVVMKPIGTQLTRVPGIVGATVLGDGAVVFVINPVQLAHRQAITEGALSVKKLPPVQAVKPIALVVDDSLTMRKVLSRVLERNGFDVVTANDGVDAIQKLLDMTPTIILTDIEMPRMDGFEFAKHVRDTEKIATLPMVMISSRTANKHRQLAKEIGVNAFLGKPVQDDELIEIVKKLLKQ